MLTNEIELIQDDKLREFAVEAISRIEGGPNQAAYVSKVVKYLWEFCIVIDADDAIRDVMITAGLIHNLDLAPHNQHQLQPYSLRIYLNDLMPLIGREAFDNLMYLVTRQLGFQTVFPEITPKIDDPIHVWMLPLAIALANKE